MSIGYVYILKCSNGMYYTGSTRFLDYRVNQHKQGLGSKFTRRNLPVELVYFEKFPYLGQALKMEQRIKGFSRKKKCILINSSRNLLRKDG